MVTKTRKITVAEFGAMAEDPGHRYELVDGELVDMDGAPRHGIIVAECTWLLKTHVRAARLPLDVGTSTGFQMDIHTLRFPDVHVTSWARMAAYDEAAGGFSRLFRRMWRLRWYRRAIRRRSWRVRLGSILPTGRGRFGLWTRRPAAWSFAGRVCRSRFCGEMICCMATRKYRASPAGCRLFLPCWTGGRRRQPLPMARGGYND